MDFLLQTMAGQHIVPPLQANSVCSWVTDGPQSAASAVNNALLSWAGLIADQTKCAFQGSDLTASLHSLSSVPHVTYLHWLVKGALVSEHEAKQSATMETHRIDQWVDYITLTAMSRSVSGVNYFEMSASLITEKYIFSSPSHDQSFFKDQYLSHIWFSHNGTDMNAPVALKLTNYHALYGLFNTHQTLQLLLLFLYHLCH